MIDKKETNKSKNPLPYTHCIFLRVMIVHCTTNNKIQERLNVSYVKEILIFSWK